MHKIGIHKEDNYIDFVTQRDSCGFNKSNVKNDLLTN